MDVENNGKEKGKIKKEETIEDEINRSRRKERVEKEERMEQYGGKEWREQEGEGGRVDGEEKGK